MRKKFEKTARKPMAEGGKREPKKKGGEKRRNGVQWRKKTEKKKCL